MKKTMSLACLVIILAAALAAPGEAAIKLSFKLNGGAALLLNGAGDLEKFRQGEKAYAADWEADDFSSATFNWKKMSLVPEMGGEVILFFTPKIGVGLGVGYVVAKGKGDYTLTYNENGTPWWGTYSETESYGVRHDFKGSAIPITLNFHFQTPLSTKFNFVAHAGVGYYLGKFKHTNNETLNYAYSFDSWYYINQKHSKDVNALTTNTATCNKIGFQAGAGLEMLLTPKITIGFEIYGRYVDFDRFKGDSDYRDTTHERFWHETLGWWYDVTTNSSDNEKGDLYFWEWHSNYYNQDYATLGIRESAPSGSGVNNVRRAAINLNRIGALITVRYSFSL